MIEALIYGAALEAWDRQRRLRGTVAAFTYKQSQALYVFLRPDTW